MPKKKKTRQQKILADKRHETVPPPHLQQLSHRLSEKPQETPHQNYSFSPASPYTSPSPQFLPHTRTDLKYLARDLKKTVIVTAIIVITQVLLRFTLS